MKKLGVDLFTNDVTIKFNVLSSLMESGIMSQVDSLLAITINISRRRKTNMEILKQVVQPL